MKRLVRSRMRNGSRPRTDKLIWKQTVVAESQIRSNCLLGNSRKGSVWIRTARSRSTKKSRKPLHACHSRTATLPPSNDLVGKSLSDIVIGQDTAARMSHSVTQIGIRRRLFPAAVNFVKLVHGNSQFESDPRQYPVK